MGKSRWPSWAFRHVPNMSTDIRGHEALHHHHHHHHPNRPQTTATDRDHADQHSFRRQRQRRSPNEVKAKGDHARHGTARHDTAQHSTARHGRSITSKSGDTQRATNRITQPHRSLIISGPYEPLPALVKLVCPRHTTALLPPGHLFTGRPEKRRPNPCRRNPISGAICWE